MRRLLAVLLATLLLPSLSAGASDPDVVTIAVIDTGIDPTHQEFRAGQVVAWRDFTAEASPTPQDGHGHGTATASLVAGLNAGSCGTGLADRKLSYAPGAPLVIARVGDDAGAITGSVEQAIAWSVAQGADVISISIGSVIPTFASATEEIQAARDAGVLVVVSAGNGLLNAGAVPYPTWASVYGHNEEALVVGGANANGQALTSTTGNMDPDVVSWSDAICVALANTGDEYSRWSGTSFSTPLVAGMSASVLQRSRDAGHPLDAEGLEVLMSRASTNNPLVPYAREGLGSLMAREHARALAHAEAGTLPDYAAQGAWAEADLAYHETVLGGFVRRA